MCGDHMKLKERVEALEKELETLKKDYGRLCQNDSVMRTENGVAFKRLDKQAEDIKDLKLIITNLQQECRRLYSQGFDNGMEAARVSISNDIKTLEDRGLITYHGFLNTEPNDSLKKLSDLAYNQLGIHTDKSEPISATKMADEAWRKWAEASIGYFKRGNILSKEELYEQMKVTQVDPVEADYYRQMDKVIKDTEE